MKHKKISIVALAIVIIVVLSLGIYFLNQNKMPSNSKNINSPYLGQENRPIKSLSEEDIKSLEEGTGIVFNGLAKLAELNGYPGPRHVLDMKTELNLTEKQISQTQAVYADMKSKAIRIGRDIIDLEKHLNDSFKNKETNSAHLKTELDKSGDLYGELRDIHLQAHIKMMDILTPEQVEKYNALRGYTSNVGNDPCQNIPEGHDPEMWKLHNGCK